MIGAIDAEHVACTHWLQDDSCVTVISYIMEYSNPRTDKKKSHADIIECKMFWEELITCFL
jgi:hypothetical protein